MFTISSQFSLAVTIAATAKRRVCAVLDDVSYLTDNFYRSMERQYDVTVCLFINRKIQPTADIHREREKASLNEHEGNHIYLSFDTSCPADVRDKVFTYRRERCLMNGVGRA